MSSLIIATAGDSVTLSLVLGDGGTGMYPTAYVYDEAGSLDATVDLSHTSLGRYAGSFTVGSGRFFAHYVVYSDAGRTTVSPLYQADQDTITTELASQVWDAPRSGVTVAGSMGEAVRLMLGSIGKANYRIDNAVYDANSFMTSCRLRVFPDSATATASTAGGSGEGELYTVTVSGTPDGTFPQLPSTVLGLF